MTEVALPDNTPNGVGIQRRWWLEVIYVLIFYLIYTTVRNQFGSGGNFATGTQRALDNAILVINIEKSMGLFVEEAMQTAVLGSRLYLQFWNIFYGSLHFIVTGGAMIFLYIRYPVRYRRYRNVLLATTSLALIGFVSFPLMPPRLLNAGGAYGANRSEYTFVDTLVEFGGLWSFDSETMQALSNQWAAMPSLHISWAMWCTVALYPVLRSATAQTAIVLYPIFTLYAIVVTANHYWIDAVGGALILWAGWHIGTTASRWIAPRLAVVGSKEHDRSSPDAQAQLDRAQ